MVLYLLGIPLAIAGAKILHDDIKYTTMNLRIENASSDVNIQYRQIEEHFADILKFSGAKCDIKKISYDNYEIKNVQKGQYGGMERYLAEKGFYPQAISHAKKLFDNIADKENRIKNQKRDKRINIYERKLLTERTNDVVISVEFNRLSYNKPKLLVEKDVEKLSDYFHAHNNENVFCNIIMENDNYWHHKEVWHIKEPNSENAKKYYDDVYDKIINNSYSNAPNDESHEPNWAPKLIPQEKIENKKKYIRYAMSYRDSGENEKALEYFKKVLDIDPNFTTALIKAGYCLMDLGRYDEAITYLERLSYPYNRELSHHIEYCYSKLKDRENPDQTKNDNKKEEGNDSYNCTTDDLYELNRKQREINLSKYNKKDRNDYISTKKEEDNNSHCCASDELYELNRKQREINLSKYNKKYGNNNQSTKELHNNVKSNNNNKSSVYYYNLGFQYKSSAQKEKAVEYFKKALDIDPKFTTACEQLGYTLEELGRYDEAIEYLEKVDYDYDSAVSRHIADCYIKLGESGSPYMDNEDYSSDSQRNNINKTDKLSSKGFDSWSKDSVSTPIIIELDNVEENIKSKKATDNSLNTKDLDEMENDVNYLSKIKEAKELLDDGAITQEEYDVLKRKFLDLI